MVMKGLTAQGVQALIQILDLVGIYIAYVCHQVRNLDQLDSLSRQLKQWAYIAFTI